MVVLLKSKGKPYHIYKRWTYCLLGKVVRIQLINKMLWAVASAMILLSGVYFTLKLNVQFKFKKMLTNLCNHTKNGISPFSSLMLNLGAKIGVGCIAGIALAIYIGGKGTIFWMWIITFISSPNTYAETFLSILFRENDGSYYKGGPSYYIEKGLKKPRLGFVYALIVIASYLWGFNPIQSNTITKSLNEIIKVNPHLLGLVLSFITALVIFGGLKNISKVSDKIVPFMILFFLTISGFIIIKNYQSVPSIFLSIIKDALNIKPFLSGFVITFIVGMQRGIFASESGLGTGSITSATVNDNNPANQSYVQLLSVYITSLLICTTTAIIVLLSKYQLLVFDDLNGIEMIQYAFRFHLGDFGDIFVFITIFFFAFSSILTGYYYIEANYKYINKNYNSFQLFILKIICLLFLFLGSITPSLFIWKWVDLLVALLAIINIYALIKLRRHIKK